MSFSVMNTTCMVHCLQVMIPTSAIEYIILDSAAIVNIMKPTRVPIFHEYVTEVFLLYIKKQWVASQASQVDIV